MQGIQARIKLFSGALVLNYATVDRLLRDMDDNILKKIEDYMKMDIKGWKLNPHVWGDR